MALNNFKIEVKKFPHIQKSYSHEFNSLIFNSFALTFRAIFLNKLIKIKIYCMRCNAFSNLFP